MEILGVFGVWPGFGFRAPQEWLSLVAQPLQSALRSIAPGAHAFSGCSAMLVLVLGERILLAGARNLETLGF